MLKVENISSGYGKKQVLFDVSLEVNKSEVVLLTGGNGSGKSTLFKCIFNLLPCWSGQVLFENEKINGLQPYELIKKGIIYIPQKNFYFENLTVEENLKITGNILSKNKLKERIKEVFELTGLENIKKRKPFNLSGGERKILAFGMALMHKPKMLLFDEPFAGVDSQNLIILNKLLKKIVIQPENIVVFVEHKDNAKYIFNRKINIELGKIVKS